MNEPRGETSDQLDRSKKWQRRDWAQAWQEGYSIINVHKHTCMHADTRDRKLILTAGSEKAKWKQLPRKGWEKWRGGQDTGEAANYCTWNKIYGWWKVKNVSLLFYGRERVMVNLLLPTERLKSSSVTTAASWIIQQWSVNRKRSRPSQSAWKDGQHLLFSDFGE